MIEITVQSSLDGTKQPSLFYPAKEKSRPLIVGLHTWSYDRNNQVERLLPIAASRDWNLLLPEFRGPNCRSNPSCRDACGSEKAKQDIMDAVSYVLENYSVDGESIFIVGASGGGTMALLMAAYAPRLWRGVCSFVPITDIRKWYDENPSYRDSIEACCGGGAGFDAECAARSPITYTDHIAQATVKIFTGKWDAAVPAHHGLDLFMKIFKDHPEAEVYFEMFDGGHEMPLPLAFDWVASCMENKKKVGARVTG